MSNNKVLLYNAILKKKNTIKLDKTFEFDLDNIFELIYINCNIVKLY